MTKQYTTAAIALLGLVLFAVGGVLYVRGRNAGPTPAEIEDGAGSDVVVQLLREPVAVPAFTVTDLEGKTASSADWRGKVVLINFWATWCGPCRAEIPDLVALQQKYRDHLVVVGISEDEGSTDLVKRFAAEQRMNYPIVMSNDEIRRIFPGVMALPTTFILDKDGRLVQKRVGLLSRPHTEAATRVLAGLSTNAQVERVEDPSKLDLSNAAEIKDIPGVDLGKVPAGQKNAVLQALNADTCTCGCGLTVAKCRVEDPSCQISQPLAQSIVDKFVAAP